jgi:hypothetical protein
MAHASGFFQPPPSPWPEQAERRNAPPWTGRPQGPPLGATVTELPLARSELAAVLIAYIDAYPDGFELEIATSTRVAFHDLRRERDGSADIFGRHWPMVGESRDAIPPQLLRIGIQYADGRAATNIAGHDRPLEGPVMSPLSGGGGGSGGESHFHQGYWISPLPPPGPVAVVCEWPALEVPLQRREVDAQLILDAADCARAMFADGNQARRDGRAWRLGTDTDLAWINSGTSAGTAITCAIPPVFAAYCTVVLPQGAIELAAHEQAVIELLTAQTDGRPWWLGYLDTGASDVVFPYAPGVTVYYGYRYVLVEAGPQQAISWRDPQLKGALPDLMFPADRSWLLSTMWDDDWTCIGGSEQLVASFLTNPTLGPRARRVVPGEDATPPGHEAD